MNRIELIELCGEEAVNNLSHRADIQKQINALRDEKKALEIELGRCFSVDITVTDVLVSTVAGIVCGAMNGAFKTYIPSKGKFKHEHTVRRTAVDYKVPSPKGFKGSAQGLHRQIGPGHDIGRFREALDLMSGKKKDFPLWGKTISEQTGGILHIGGMSIEKFNKLGGFNIPEDPKAELMNHLLIDFFSKTSLPLPFTSYIADYNQVMAKLMMGMYGNGLNLKNAVGNSSSLAMLRLITHGYAYLFKAASKIELYSRLGSIKKVGEIKELWSELNAENKRYVKSREFNVLQAIAHGSSFLVDTVVNTTSKNYTGLFSLDYGTLICFATDVVKYVKKSLDNQNDLLSKISEVNEKILSEEQAWYDAYRADMLKLAETDGFYDTFDPEKIMARQEEIIAELNEGHGYRSKALSELREWDLDEDF